MVGVTVSTSKEGRLWATEHWKTLIDSVCRGGSKHDPRLRYPTLVRNLASLVREDSGRFVPTSESRLAQSDDTAISSLCVIRARAGDESFSLHDPEIPNISTSGWALFEFRYFGTIGDSDQEAQTKSNYLALAARENEFTQFASPKRLMLHFQLSAVRRDRDLDNLGDALMPFFNKRFPMLDEIDLSKAKPHHGEGERLWVRTFQAVRSNSLPSAA